MLFHRNSRYNHNAKIINHIEDLAEKQGFNRFVTLSFTYSGYGSPLWLTDVATVTRLVNLYFKKISYKLNGRPRSGRKDNPPPIPAIAIPEYRNASNGSGFLHVHTIIKVPDDQLDLFHEVTQSFWKHVVKNNIKHPPKIDSRKIYNPRGLARYIMKNIQDGFTVENAVLSGFN